MSANRRTGDAQEQAPELAGLAEDAQKACDAIAAVVGLEVEIVDKNLLRIAGTGKYRLRVGHSLEHEGAVYRQVLRTGQGTIVTRPGLEPICGLCSKYGSCDEKAELSAPIAVEGDIVGVIGLVCFDQSQRARLLDRLECHKNFIEHMAGLLASKIREHALLEQERRAAQEVAALLDRMADPVLAVDQNGRLVHYNVPAGRLLNIPDGDGFSAAQREKRMVCSTEELGFLESTLRTKEGFEEKEMFLSFGGVEKPYLVSATPLASGGLIYGAMAVIRPLGELHRWAYNLTNAVKVFTLNDIIGESPAIQLIKEKALKVAGGKSNILITGESGAGKELLARGIHNASGRADRPFVAVNCAAIPDTLLESELFGYEEGAFTGARKGGKPGKFELADGGTIFLDEIGEMPIHLQAKLLRVLEGWEVERVGGTRSRPIDVRLMAASNQDLEGKIACREFREDLYFRLNVIPLQVPPLRDREGDTPLLARYFIRKHAALLNKKIEGMEPSVARLFESYWWPGNVRELENTIEHAANIESTSIIHERSLPETIRTRASSVSRKLRGHAGIDDMEARLIEKTLGRYGYSYRGKQQAARELGIGIATLYRKMARYGIPGVHAAKR
ncbi:MAG: sigma 54-interacting transcriptional regulator [Clostridia bacterium]|nr:sigma 54-interacting transcriptional regulator [Clostridia bacterium]